MIDYQNLMNWKFSQIEQKITHRDVILYALGVGVGADPLDRDQLRFVYEKDLMTFPSMASIFGYPGNWLRDTRTGVNYGKIVNGGTKFVIHQTLPTQATLVCTPRVLEIVDKGQGKGALVIVERKVHEKASNALICTVTTTTFCRADGGFGGPDKAITASPRQVPDRRPDGAVEFTTARNLALLYRLNGDQNPIHADPDIAMAAGFKEPILHGLSTMGVATHAILKGCCGYDPTRLESVNVRYTAPVIPGDTISTQFWKDGSSIQFQSIVPSRQASVLVGEASLRI